MLLTQLSISLPVPVPPQSLAKFGLAFKLPDILVLQQETKQGARTDLELTHLHTRVAHGSAARAFKNMMSAHRETSNLFEGKKGA